MRALRKFSICHNEDDHKNPNHRRVHVEIYHMEHGYVWRNREDGTDIGLGTYQTVAAACGAAQAAYGTQQACWAMRAAWAN